MKGLLRALGFFILLGCATSITHFTKEGEFKGYPVRVGVKNEGRRITIYSNSFDSKSKLTALDTDNDGRFDEVYLRNLEKGHPLEQYEPLDSLNKIYDEVLFQ